MYAKRIHVNDVLTDAHEMPCRTLGEDIHIKLELTTDLPAVIAERGQVEHAVLNLALNAQDALSPGGKLSLETGLTDVSDGLAGLEAGTLTGRCVRVAVRDDGHGMDPMTRERMFEPFFTT